MGFYRGPPACAELGFWLGRPWWGHGYATEASRAVVHHGFNPRLPAFSSAHFIDNPASAGCSPSWASSRWAAARIACTARQQDVEVVTYWLDRERASVSMRAARTSRSRRRAGAPGSDCAVGAWAAPPNEVPRPGQDLHHVGRGRGGLRLLPAREVHRVRRARRGRRRQGRRRVGLGLVEEPATRSMPRRPLPKMLLERMLSPVPDCTRTPVMTWKAMVLPSPAVIPPTVFLLARVAEDDAVNLVPQTGRSREIGADEVALRWRCRWRPRRRAERPSGWPRSGCGWRTDCRRSCWRQLPGSARLRSCFPGRSVQSCRSR